MLPRLLQRQCGVGGSATLQQPVSDTYMKASAAAGVPRFLGSSVFGVEYSGDGRSLLATLESGECCLIDTRCSGAPVQHLQGHRRGRGVNIAKFWQNWFVTASDDCTLCLWDSRTLRPILRFVGHRGWCKNCEPLSDNLMISSSFDGTVRLWDALTSNGVPSVCVACDGVGVCGGFEGCPVSCVCRRSTPSRAPTAPTFSCSMPRFDGLQFTMA